jgi:hypothetical protein
MKQKPAVGDLDARSFASSAHLADRIAFTLAEASQISGLSITTLRRHFQNGRLESHRVGGRRLVDAISLRRLIRGESE